MPATLEVRTIDRALTFAAKAHEGQIRKGTKLPYIHHPIQVAEILQSHGFSEDLIAVGYLHDTVEDTQVTYADLRREFGDHVADLVREASEPEDMLKGGQFLAPWKARKEHTIHFVEHHATDDILPVVCADKLANVQEAISDESRMGKSYWKNFRSTKEEQGWYYQSVATALENRMTEGPSLALFREFKSAVRQFFGEKTIKLANE